MTPDYTPRFRKDVEKLKRKKIDTMPLRAVIELVLENTAASLEELRRRHNMHALKGNWAGSNECHVANAGDWLLIWSTGNGVAVFERTGSHDSLFR